MAAGAQTACADAAICRYSRNPTFASNR